jgi:heme oxygenase (biliverdin-IX-beta and delta-forming)
MILQRLREETRASHDAIEREFDAMRAQTSGSLHVLEGSTLGGQVIAPRLERSLGFADGRGYTFFRSYGREVGAMWRGLGARLLALPAPAGEAAVGSAQLTFARLHGWLCRGDRE